MISLLYERDKVFGETNEANETNEKDAFLLFFNKTHKTAVLIYLICLICLTQTLSLSPESSLNSKRARHSAGLFDNS